MKTKVLAVSIIALFAASANAGSVTTDGEDLVISTQGGLKVATKDKSRSFQFGGRLQWDYDATDSDSSGKKDDFDVRRARLYTKGHVNDWAFKVQFNIAETDGSGGGDAEDLYVRYTGFGKAASITVGKQKEPFGLEELTSSKDITSLERSAMTEFYSPGRNAGIQVHGKGKNWTYGIGLFEADGDSSNDFDNTALTARATFAPLKDEGRVVHLGAGFTFREADTRDDEVDNYNLELGTVLGAFHAQAEYFNGEKGNSSVDGYYVQAGWIFSGESRPYKDGIFKRVKPASPSGAWEAVLRYEDGDGKYSDIGLSSSNGEQTTIGLNYYANNNVRLGLSYMDGEVNSGGSTFSGDELRARVQLVF